MKIFELLNYLIPELGIEPRLPPPYGLLVIAVRIFFKITDF
jgi:hypothetical protein